MAKRKISIFDSFLSGGRVGNNFRSSANATLNASTRIRSREACAIRYFSVALRRRLRSSRERFASDTTDDDVISVSADAVPDDDDAIKSDEDPTPPSIVPDCADVDDASIGIDNAAADDRQPSRLMAEVDDIEPPPPFDRFRVTMRAAVADGGG